MANGLGMRSRLRSMTASWMAWSSASASVKVWWARPGAGEIGMRQRLALIAVEKNDVARFGLPFAQLQAQAHPFHLAFRLASLQRVPRPPPAELFFARPWTVANG